MTRTAHRPTEAQLVLVILADQLSALRGQIADAQALDCLHQCSEQLHAAAAGAEPLSAVMEVADTLDKLAFRQAQCLDLRGQTVDCVILALNALAQQVFEGEAEFSRQTLAALYVSNSQRDAHDATLGRLSGDVDDEA